MGTHAVAEKLVLANYDEYIQLVAKAYAARPMHEAGVDHHWAALVQHVRKMFKRIQSQVNVQFVAGQPYDVRQDAADLKQDVAAGVLKVSTDDNEHAIFSPEENLMFRAVHDFMTHVHGGQRRNYFKARGEIGAYNRHAILAPPEARPALFTEVVGQASVVLVTGKFPPQKIALLYGFDYVMVGRVDAEAYRLNFPSTRMEAAKQYRRNAGVDNGRT